MAIIPLEKELRDLLEATNSADCVHEADNVRLLNARVAAEKALADIAVGRALAAGEPLIRS
jgi:hypothetical protein